MRLNILDMRTVIFSDVICDIICVGVMIFLWLQNRRQIAGLGFWLAYFLMQFTGELLIYLSGIVPDFASIIVSNALEIGGTILLYMGLERFTGKLSSQRHNFILLVGFIFIQAYFTFVKPSPMIRNINVYVCLFILYLQCAWLMLHRVKTEIQQDSKIAGIIFVLYGLINFAFIFEELMMPEGNDFFKSGLPDILGVLIFQMLCIALTFALVLMVNRRLFTELEQDITERKQAEEALKTSEEKYSIAFQNLPDAIMITSIADGKIIEANESFFRISEYSKEETIGETTIDLNLWGRLKDRNKFVKELQKSGRVVNYETNFRRKSGELFPGLISGGVIQIQKKNYGLTVIHDVSYRKQIEETLRLDSQMMANISDGILLYKDSNRTIVYTNPQFEKLFGYEPNEMIGKPVSILNTPTDKSFEEISKEINKSVTKNGVWDGEIQNIKKDGTYFWCHASVSSFTHHEYGTVWVSVQQDITEGMIARTKLEYVSTHDSLTGLYNRTFFDEEMKRFERGRQFPISIVMMDVDDLKIINDGKGHLAGDKLLQRTAQVLNNSFRGDDIVVRIGGDEFAALLPNTDEIAAQEVLKRIQSNLQKNNDAEIGTTLIISLGISTADKGTELKNAFQQADKSMYQEKSKKK
jgi:diguanylate cyclase (GGDEF)-like protein/PAS domain S-box-containing protein